MIRPDELQAKCLCYQLNAQVDLYHRPAAEVAAMFLTQANLK
jgi:hypothetical protein